MVFERGPVAFVDESVKLVRKSLSEEDSAMQHLCQSSSSHMFDRMRVLMELRSSLASFLAQVYHQSKIFIVKLCACDSLLSMGFL